MASPTRIFALNLGMQTVTLAEFRDAPGGGLTLQSCAQEELIVDPAADATRSAQIGAAVERLRKTLGLKSPDTAIVCLPSQSVFTRFVRLPGSSPGDVESIIGFEAQQNVPFPIDEVVWDHQIIGDSRDGNWNVALVAIKADQLGEVHQAIHKAGFKSSIIDVAPMALCNAFRFNYGDQTGCSVLVDVGARTTNLIFIEDNRAFSRSIPLGGSTISAALAKEFKQDITFAEKLKIEKGFVGLGGAYADPSDPTEARISKIVRNTMTRLHAEIARSISFYRQNQNGSAPVRAFLCGNSVSLPYMMEFFREKLQLPVEYFNPLRNITIGQASTAEFIANRAHGLGEVVGCALRTIKNCPVEINLPPPAMVREQNLARRKPFLILAAACLLLALGGWWYYLDRAATLTQEQLESVNAESGGLDKIASQFTALDTEKEELRQQSEPFIAAATDRNAWGTILDELGTRLPPKFIWITTLKPLLSSGSAPNQPGQPAPPPRPGGQGGTPGGRAGGSEIQALEIGGLYLANPPNDKEARIIDEFVDRLRQSPAFKMDDKKNQDIVTQRMTPDGKSWAYSYTIILPLRNPIPLP